MPPTYTTTAKRGLRWLTGSNLVRDIDAGFQALAEDADNNLMPAGTILATGRATAPTGFLLCDGAAVSRTTYAGLFTAIATAYGVGNGTTTFNLPDLRGRVPVGVDGAAARLTANDAQGNAAGAEKVTMVDTNLPTGRYPRNTGGFDLAFSGSGGISVVSASTVSDAVGTSTPMDNMQPYQVVNYMIAI